MELAWLTLVLGEATDYLVVVAQLRSHFDRRRWESTVMGGEEMDCDEEGEEMDREDGLTLACLMVNSGRPCTIGQKPTHGVKNINTYTGIFPGAHLTAHITAVYTNGGGQLADFVRVTAPDANFKSRSAIS